MKIRAIDTTILSVPAPEPIALEYPEDDLAGCAEVARSIAIPVATGENNYTRFEFRELIEHRAARYLLPDVCRANGHGLAFAPGVEKNYRFTP